jgi:prepilin-type N-terminal cleavage/methylation domain-containing protein
MNMKNNYKRGFTLIELLVVVAIIGLLVSVISVALTNARSKTRDSNRLSDMRAMQTAIALALDSGTLPPMNYFPLPNAWFDYLVPTYIPSIPSEKFFSTSTDRYYYCNRNNFTSGQMCHNDNDQSTYAIRFRTENKTSLGPAGYYCATSDGIFSRSNGNNGSNKCEQR